MRRRDWTMLLGLALFAWVLKQDPRCDRHCQTVADHLLNHVLGNLLGGS